MRSIVELAETLRLIVAEGIETDEQWAELRRLHAEKGQGFLLALPMDADDLSRALRAGPSRAPHPLPTARVA